MLIVGNHHLLADAKFTEDMAQDVVRGDFACDGAEVVEYLADLFTDEIRRESVLETR